MYIDARRGSPARTPAWTSFGRCVCPGRCSRAIVDNLRAGLPSPGVTLNDLSRPPQRPDYRFHFVVVARFMCELDRRKSERAEPAARRYCRPLAARRRPVLSRRRQKESICLLDSFKVQPTHASASVRRQHCLRFFFQFSGRSHAVTMRKQRSSQPFLLTNKKVSYVFSAVAWRHLFSRCCTQRS